MVTGQSWSPGAQITVLLILSDTHPVLEGGWADGSLGTVVTWVTKSRWLGQPWS